MNNQVPATRPERERQRRSEIAERIAAVPALSIEARLERIAALLTKQKLVAHASRNGQITDTLYEDDAAVQMQMLRMVHELMDEFPAKAVKVDARVSVEQLVAMLGTLTLEQRAALDVESTPVLEAGDEADDA